MMRGVQARSAQFTLNRRTGSGGLRLGVMAMVDLVALFFQLLKRNGVLVPVADAVFFARHQDIGPQIKRARIIRCVGGNVAPGVGLLSVGIFHWRHQNSYARRDDLGLTVLKGFMKILNIEIVTPLGRPGGVVETRDSKLGLDDG